METIEERLIQLERTARLWKAASLLLVMTVALVAAVGWRQAKPAKVVATEFQLVDSKGIERGSWRTLEDDPQRAGVIFEIKNKEGQVASYMFVYDSWLVYGSGSPTPVARLCVGTGAAPYILVGAGEKGSPQIVLGEDNRPTRNSKSATITTSGITTRPAK